jgi:protein-L-isoaspartate(D-aspartate) O-methyltransferase
MSFFSRFGSEPRRRDDRTIDAGEPRARMVRDQIRARGVRDPRVLAAMEEVPRHLFVPPVYLEAAYADQALPMGLAVLEVGTGSGYQAAVLAACGTDVYSVERIPELHRAARESLEAAGYLDRVHLRLDDGSRGWPEEAPFPRILVTAAAERLPVALVDQLAPDGLLVAPVGDPHLQTICRYRKLEGRLERQALEGARFVPLVEGAAPQGSE